MLTNVLIFPIIYIILHNNISFTCHEAIYKALSHINHNSHNYYLSVMLQTANHIVGKDS